MNATVFATNVDSLIEAFGNSMVYHPPDNSSGYNTAGDWDPTYQTTTTGSKWVEPNRSDSREYAEKGIYPLKENEAIVKNSITVTVRGKIVSNSINWEVVDKRPIRIKDQTVYNLVVCKQIV